jgi:hypothetical protein
MHQLATVFRTFIRWFLAVSAFWLAARGAWLLLLFGRAAAHPAGLCVGLILMAGGAWQWLVSLENRHEAILAKHRRRIPVPSAVVPKALRHVRPAVRPKALSPAVPGLVAQLG